MFNFDARVQANKPHSHTHPQADKHNDDDDNDGYLISHFVNILLINGRLVKFIGLKIYAFIVGGVLHDYQML